MKGREGRYCPGLQDFGSVHVGQTIEIASFFVLVVVDRSLFPLISTSSSAWEDIG